MDQTKTHALTLDIFKRVKIISDESTSLPRNLQTTVRKVLHFLNISITGKGSLDLFQCHFNAT